MAYELQWEPHGVYKRLSGVVSGEEFIASVEEVQGHAQFDRVRYVINDFSEVNSHGLSDQVLVGLAALQYGAHARNPRCRIFFVTRDEELPELINKYLVDGHMVSYEVIVTQTVAEARLWLETRPATFRLHHKYGYRDYLGRTA